MEPITIAIMSDLHIGINARSRDLCPSHYDTKIIDEEYKSKFTRFLEDNDIKADYLFLPGDVSDTASPDELELASKFIFDVCDRLGIPADNAAFVPGNHEVDWKVLSCEPDDRTGFRRAQRYAPLQSEDWIFNKIISCAHDTCLTFPHYSIWDHENLFAVGYNSSWHDDPDIAIHNGLISEDDLHSLDDYLSAVDLGTEKLKSFIVHHHPIQYSNPIPDEPDFSAMTNSSNLLQLLQKYNFDLLVHGHKHSPYFRCEIVNSGFPIIILGSGSFSAKLDSSWSGYVNNQFHLIKAINRDPITDCISGVLESWTYLSGAGWKESKIHNGIRHKMPFGHYVQPAVFKRNLEHILTNQFSTAEYVEWGKIVEIEPGYRYLPPELILKIINDLGREMGFRPHGDEPEELIFLRKRT